MACQEVQIWSLSGLVAAFLDLAIAYLLLCASAVAYFVSKFLGFFGLSLPCPCDGLFCNIHNKSLCLNRLLIDAPTQIVSDVQLSVKHKFPFSGSICPNNTSYTIGGTNSVNGIFEIEGEASCSSVSDERRVEKYDMKGKRVMSHWPRSGRLRQRRKSGVDQGEYSFVSSRSGTSTGGRGLIVGGSLLVDNGDDGHRLEYNNKAPTLRELRQRSVTNVQKNYDSEEDIPSNEEPKYSPNVVQSFSEDEKNAIRILEQALEEEQIARAALYVDLEKERSAAATAADEAMAMILRLQEEKASIEMEARQYQRIFEEKSAYDAEEMNILKEILVRREREKHFLEKEVEEYKQMLSLENEESGSVSVDPNDDPVQILHQLIASTDKKDERSNLQIHGDSDDQSDSVGNMDLQEKEMISVGSNVQSTSKLPQEYKLLENSRPLEGKEFEQIEEMNLEAEKIIETCNRTETSHDLMLDKESNVYDVHVIGDGIHFCKGGDFSASSSSEVSVRKRVNVITDSPSTSSMETEVDIKRSSSEIISSGLPPKGPRGSRRNSTSALDSEMVKIDSEVGRLRERLKLVQEGREKLSIPLENRERENVQLKLLEDIAQQVQEIRHLTVPEKALRQVSLPLPTSKVFSKKRRCRSVSSGFRL